MDDVLIEPIAERHRAVHTFREEEQRAVRAEYAHHAQKHHHRERGPYERESDIEQSPDKMKELAEKIIKKIHLASPSNVFAICNQLSFEEPIQKETFNIDLFVPVLEYVAAQLYITEESDNYYNIYSRILKLKDRLKVPYAKKEHLFSQFLMELKLDELVVKS